MANNIMESLKERVALDQEMLNSAIEGEDSAQIEMLMEGVAWGRAQLVALRATGDAASTSTRKLALDVLPKVLQKVKEECAKDIDPEETANLLEETQKVLDRYRRLNGYLGPGTRAPVAITAGSKFAYGEKGRLQELKKVMQELEAGNRSAGMIYR